MVIIAVLAALVLGVVVLVAFADLAGGSSWPFADASPPAIDSSKWYDVTRSSIAVVGLAGLGGGAIIAYRRQQTAERRQTVEEARQKTEAARQLTEEARSSLERDRHAFEVEKRKDGDIADLRARYAKAAEQLGHAKAAVRLAGVYAMTALSDDWFAAGNAPQQKVCVDVLCAYLRMPYEPESADIGEKEVRLTIFSVVRDKMLDPDLPSSWCEMSLDFTGAVVDGGTLSGVTIGGQLVFDRAKFLGDFSLENTKFIGGDASFRYAEFARKSVSFRGATIHTGDLRFNYARFSGGELSFASANLYGGTISFTSAEISSGRIAFDKLVMSGGKISVYWPIVTGGLMTFSDAELKGGRCEIGGWSFSGGAIRFHQTKFVGTDVDTASVLATDDSSFVLDFSSPRLWTVPPKIPGATDKNKSSHWWGASDFTGIPAAWVIPQEWPPSEDAGVGW